ncbi:MAG: hypothetical protein JO320_10540 [Alphaproteobacteria bacterium]|nr:hypothetical protein [Alphaproteobacteria bacterium]MBV9375477.1 hypothetical protein [Alphaproteobacteria bacterium]
MLSPTRRFLVAMSPRALRRDAVCSMASRQLVVPKPPFELGRRLSSSLAREGASRRREEGQGEDC